VRRELVYLSSIGADCCEAAREFGLGIELAQFCTAARLDGAPPEPWELPVERCLSASSRFVLHGPFNELTPAAIDPLVLDVTKKRYQQAIKKADTMGIQKIVLHAGFLPLVYYPEWFVERSAAVWRELLCDVPDDMTVCLENVLEPEPQLLTAIMEAVHDPRLRICLDLGHANSCASALPPENWLRACAPYLSHVHLHNNQGGRDLHAALFDGVMDIAGLLSLLEALSPQARPAAFITDCQIETDREAFIPDEYVGSSTEKIRLYRELDNIADEERLSVFEANLRDRFGEVPAPTRELFDVVRMRWACIRLGFEKAIVKNGIMILKFIENQHSAYYKSDLFGGILKAATRAESKFIFRQNNNKLSVVVRNIKNISEATAALHELAEKAAQ